MVWYGMVMAMVMVMGMICYSMLCYVILCYVMLCCAMLCYVMLCYVYIYMIRSESQNWGQWVWAIPMWVYFSRGANSWKSVELGIIGRLAHCWSLCQRFHSLMFSRKLWLNQQKNGLINQFNKKSWGPNQQNSQGINHQLKTLNQWEFQDPKMEVPTIYKAYFLGLCKGISPENMALYGTVPPF